MYVISLSVFRRYTRAPLNALGAVTVPETVAIPGIAASTTSVTVPNHPLVPKATKAISTPDTARDRSVALAHCGDLSGDDDCVVRAAMAVLQFTSSATQVYDKLL